MTAKNTNTNTNTNTVTKRQSIMASLVDQMPSHLRTPETATVEAARTVDSWAKVRLAKGIKLDLETNATRAVLHFETLDGGAYHRDRRYKCQERTIGGSVIYLANPKMWEAVEEYTTAAKKQEEEKARAQVAREQRQATRAASWLAFFPTLPKELQEARIGRDWDHERTLHAGLLTVIVRYTQEKGWSISQVAIGKKEPSEATVKAMLNFNKRLVKEQEKEQKEAALATATAETLKSSEDKS